MKYDAIILAAGSATRSKLEYNKMFYKLDGKEIICHSVFNFINDKDCKNIIIAINEKEIDQFRKLLNSNKIRYVKGGNTRQESVSNALNFVDNEYVLIHDGARPLFSNDLLNNLKNSVVLKEVVIPVIDVTDTIFKIKHDIVDNILNRNELKIVQTPQAFKTSLIKKAHDIATRNDYSDDSSMIKDLLSHDIFVIDGEIKNKKYTYSEDFK